MVFYMPAKTDETPARRDPAALAPREIVEELDRHIVGQARAKRAVAIALRNRIRRQRLPREVAEEIVPKNILMIGPTGVGKTEIARRLAKLAGSPFLKVEASKYTEVGYVGRDVESMIRDLTEIAVEMTRQEKRELLRPRAERNTEERLLSLLLPPPPRGSGAGGEGPSGGEGADSRVRTREALRDELRAGKLDEREVEIEVQQGAAGVSFQFLGGKGLEDMGVNLKDLAPGLFGGRPVRRRVPLSEARVHLLREEEEKLLDSEGIALEAVRRVEQTGIVFIDELDKIAGRERGHGPDVSREGVQRDMLPIIEGTIVGTKHGMVRTDHILFIAAGAFHVAKPSDLIPELQGRFPIRVALDALGKEEFVRILREPRSSLVRQYIALIGAEDVGLEFTDEAIEEIARFAALVNERTENIGARRLHTVMEKLLEEISFTASERSGQSVTIGAGEVHAALSELVEDQDLSRYVL